MIDNHLDVLGSGRLMSFETRSLNFASFCESLSIFDREKDNSVVNNSLSACYSRLHDVANTPIPNDVIIGFVNTQGLLSSINEIITLLPSKSVSILGVCEYFLNEITVPNVEVPGYVFTAKNRSTKSKGG